MEAHDHQRTEHKTFSKPDEVRQFPHGRAELLNVGTGQVGRLVLQPGWRWSNDVKPIAKTSSCRAPHFQYHLTGRLAITGSAPPITQSHELPPPWQRPPAGVDSESAEMPP